MVGAAVTRAFRKAKNSYVAFYRAPMQDQACGAHIWALFEGSITLEFIGLALPDRL